MDKTFTLEELVKAIGDRFFIEIFDERLNKTDNSIAKSALNGVIENLRIDANKVYSYVSEKIGNTKDFPKES